jgi:hypothetical protein
MFSVHVVAAIIVEAQSCSSTAEEARGAKPLAQQALGVSPRCIVLGGDRFSAKPPGGSSVGGYPWLI